MKSIEDETNEMMLIMRLLSYTKKQSYKRCYCSYEGECYHCKMMRVAKQLKRLIKKK